MDNRLRRILSTGPMNRRAPRRILLARDRRETKEVNQLLNPLAIGVTLGGQLLDVVVPRPKLRAGHSPEFSLLSQRAATRTGPADTVHVAELVGVPVGSGRRR